MESPSPEPGFVSSSRWPRFTALVPLRPGQPGPVVVHQDLEIAGAVGAGGGHPDAGLGPFAGIVEQVPDHLLEVLLLALELEPRVGARRRARAPRSA